ncbi:MAG: carboxypeptidase-like regulatory domain-containing protein [Proteobacteria bacterium]|nr:carboxypeptidase-like regulatory domain-containing protein [Pseudomonadota bacterium]
MNRKLLGGVVALVALVLIWFLVLRDRGDAATSTSGAPKPRAADIAAPTVERHEPSTGPAPSGAAPRWRRDLDRVGALVLEGQVVDAHGDGVGDAEVWLASVPPRKTTTEANGTFSFDKLVGRTFALVASHGDDIGGPIDVKLTDKSDPVRIQLSPAAALVVSVHDEEHHPIASAEVTLQGLGERVAMTDATGKATIKPVHPGGVAVTAVAPGYAANAGFTMVNAGPPGTLDLTLHKGFAVSGRVVDEAGKPVGKAHVVPTSAWGIGANKGEITDDQGAFTFGALAAGRVTLIATDDEHAPAQSPPVTVVDRAVTGVEITMKAGGVVAGVVVDPQQRPVAFATVRAAAVQAAQQLDGEGSFRQITADRAGAFEIRGLPRTSVQVRAESDTAASKVTTVELAKEARRELTLVLELSGTIAGVVVDEAGKPVPEVQVNAFQDFMGGGTEDIALAGMAPATTDGAGAFVLRGLPDGPYRLWASRARGREWGQQGVSAKVGDTNVRITLAAPGTLVGKLALDGGAAPKLAFVQVGWQPATAAVAGAFSIGELTPGQYEVTVRGPEFAELVKHDVKIEPGKTTDLGTLTLVRGRRLVGKVVDGKGAPVAGAKVKVGEMLFSLDGADEQVANVEEMRGVRSALTDTAGEFVIIGIPAKSMNVGAEHPDRGRSAAVAIAAGTDDPPPVTLTLKGYGSVVGNVTMQGKPQAGVTLSVSAKGGGAQATFAQSDAEGAFALAKVPEGATVISAMQQKDGGMAFRSTSVTVDVVAGKPTTVAIDIPIGTISLAVSVKALPNNHIDSAQIFLFNGTISATHAKELMDGFVGGAIKGMKFWLGKEPVEFDELTPGTYSVCSVPITGNLQDPQLVQKIQQNMDTLRVYCKPVTLAASPAKQAFVAELPAMIPLPQ